MKKHVFMLMSLCVLMVQVKAQSAGITLVAQHQPVSYYLTNFQAHFGVSFSYSTDVVNVKRNLSLKLTNATLEDALTKLFEGASVGFTIQPNLVILYKLKEAKITVSGYIKDAQTGELLIGASVATQPLIAGAVTNAYGFYSITLPQDTYQLVYSYAGYYPIVQKLHSTSNRTFTISLMPKTNLEEVTITANPVTPKAQANKIDISLQEVKEVPMILGEKDVVKFMMLSPGIQKGNEGNGYMYVRGGGPDQNLIMIDDAVVYNAYHFLGLSSLFSGNELRRAELHKGAFSSRYGGRLSSVLDLRMKDGNTEHFGLEATTGIMSSKLLIEGPIQKNKSSFLFSARRSYIDRLAGLVASSAESVLAYHYYDIHAKLSTQIGLRNRLMISSYLGNDVLGNNSVGQLSAKDDGITWGNKTVSLKWSHQFNGKVFGNAALVYSNYKARIAYGQKDESTGALTSTAIQSAINDYTVKYDLDIIQSAKHTWLVGAGFTRHVFTPQTTFTGYQPDTFLVSSETHFANEYYTYSEWKYTPSLSWKISSGLRYTSYVNKVAYHRLEPRFNASYTTRNNWQFATSYSLMNQYLHLVSAFNGVGLPSDMWLSSDENLKPQQAHVFTISCIKNNLFNKGISWIVEAYYKDLQNAVAMRDGASVFEMLGIFSGYPSAAKFSELTTQGKGRALGIETQLRKSFKKLNVQVSYTLSRTTLTIPEINLGRSYPANFDRPHDLGIYCSYRPTSKVMIAANWVYGTGNPITLPSAQYTPVVNDPLSGSLVSWYGAKYVYDRKNAFRMQDYHRLDISFQYTHRLAKKYIGTLELSLYNTYNRANPFFYEIVYENEEAGTGKKIIRKTSLFPIMPSLSWSIKL